MTRRHAISDRNDDELIKMILDAIQGNPSNLREAEHELMQRYPETKKTMDHYEAHGQRSGIRYCEALLLAILKAKEDA